MFTLRTSATFARRSILASQRSTPIASLRLYSDSKPQPKILNEKPPKEEDLPQDVQEHNKAVKNRAVRPNDEAQKAVDETAKGDATNEKVDKGFWKG
jgi:hypothetical protein